MGICLATISDDIKSAGEGVLLYLVLLGFIYLGFLLFRRLLFYWLFNIYFSPSVCSFWLRNHGQIRL